MRLPQILRNHQWIGKYMFSIRKKWDFETIMNSVHKAELLALGKALNETIHYLMYYSKWKRFKCKFTFNNDFMKSKELNLCNFNIFSVIRNKFGHVLSDFICKSKLMKLGCKKSLSSIILIVFESFFWFFRISWVIFGLTNHTILNLLENIQKALNDKQIACGIVIDLEKALHTWVVTFFLKN